MESRQRRQRSPAPPAETDGVSQFCLRHSDVISITFVGCLCRVLVRPHPVRAVHRSRVYFVLFIWFLVNVIGYGLSLIITRYVFHITMKIVHIGIKQVTNDVLGFQIWVGYEMEILVAIAFFFEFE